MNPSFLGRNGLMSPFACFAEGTRTFLFLYLVERTTGNRINSISHRLWTIDISRIHRREEERARQDWPPAGLEAEGGALPGMPRASYSCAIGSHGSPPLPTTLRHPPPASSTSVAPPNMSGLEMLVRGRRGNEARVHILRHV